MKILRNSNINNDVSFNAGLTKEVRRSIARIDVKSVEEQFAQHNIQADFYGSKPIAGCVVLASNLISEAKEKYNFLSGFLPQYIKTYKFEELSIKEPNLADFCLTRSDKTLKGEAPYPATSTFYRKGWFTSSVGIIDFLMELSHLKKRSSSNHFLHDYLHELIHAMHIDAIYKKYGFEEDNDYAKELYPNKNPSGYKRLIEMGEYSFTDKEKKQIIPVFGKYATTNKLELFAEVMTRMFVDSIDKTTMALKSNPLDQLKNYNEFIRKFMQQQLSHF